MPVMRPNIYTEAVIPAAFTTANAADIDWYSFLARPRLPSPTEDSLQQLHQASILVTGAGGSIGSALSERLASLHPRKLILLDASEQALYRLQTTLTNIPFIERPQFILGNISDATHLSEIFTTHRPRFVFHAAAHKHVSLLEANPLAAIANNTLGTCTLVECANASGVTRIVLLSTDKAVAPISILGASKRIAEQITLANNGVVLRLANVLGTEGSVVETFLRQIANGSPIQITGASAQRYFLTLEESVDLLLASAVTPQPGALLIPHLDRQYSIASLAEFLIDTCAPEVRPPITVTGLRPGDKTSEALWSSSEQPALRSEHGYFETGYETCDRPLLQRELHRLDEAVRHRDLPRAMQAVLSLVPSYQPSATIAALVQQHRNAHSGALQS
jgi:FlaA1/EpsC-like NDP-sugar epimerase